MNLNKILLIGRVGKDPEVKTLEAGKVANFSLATSEKYKDKEYTEWHNIVLWKGLAEVAEKYIKKGDLIYIEGKLRSRDWMDSEGNKRYTTEVIGNELIMLSGKKTESENSKAEIKPKPNEIKDELVDDMPW